MIYQQTIFGVEQALSAQPSSAADSRANLSAWPVSAEGKMTTGFYGPKCCALSPSLCRIGWWVKTYLESCPLPSTRFARVWSARVTTSGYWIMKLRLSEQSTGESGSDLLPTPVATLGTNGGPNQRDSSGRPGLQMAAELWVSTPTDVHKPRSARFAKGRTPNPAEAAMMWPTPRANMSTGPCVHGDGGPDLQTAVNLWPTPTVMDAIDSLVHHPRADATPTRSITLARKMAMLPTPRAHEVGDYQYDRGQRDKPRPTLTGMAKLLPTPTTPRPHDTENTAGKYIPSQNQLDLAAVVARSGGQLNPEWVGWLMGYPPGWTDVD